ncbi:MAG TPA: hypothetical protein VMJ64_19090 [Anaerolineales bacterium]|nr:hypothetical protein [Anaerolineales bacterium]
MKNLSNAAKIYIFGILLVGLALTASMLPRLPWANPGLYLLAVLGAIAQTLKVEGPNDRTNYSIAWFVYGFAFVEYGAAGAMFVIIVAHLVEWAWHKYPWYIQCFNIGAHVLSAGLAGLVYALVDEAAAPLHADGAPALILGMLAFILANHFLVGVVVWLARGQSFAESGVFAFLSLFLDFTVVSMGAVTALLWKYYPLASLLNILPLYLLYNALRVPRLRRQIEEMRAPVKAGAAGD